MILKWEILILLISGIASCTRCGQNSKLATKKIFADEHPALNNDTPNVKIIWDTAARKISHDIYFAEYGRVHRYNQDTLILTYHGGGKGNEWDNIVMRRSYDNGNNWQPPKIIVPDNSQNRYYGFSTPELLTLKNGWLLLAYTGRGKPDDSTHNNIQVTISKDAGSTWSKPLIVASGRSWEPAMIQLPDGTIQMFFSTELSSSKKARGRHEQKIVMASSDDNGKNWQTPIDIAFSSKRRDGMATPLVLKDGKGVVVAFESVYYHQSPCFIWSSVDAQWRYRGLGSESNGRRWCGTANVWGGAPYMLQLPTGEILISVQDAGGRPIERYTQWKKNTMLVLIGNSSARSFSNTSCPWPNLPNNEGAYFNSIFLKNDSTVLAVSTYNFKDKHSEIWCKEGHIKREILNKGQLAKVR
ncbi:sialidase family protein [Mucilaginibacter sp. CSA2-8R]|uniref:sialidase family protein n=1 Tax=Mucilaginibacter sp. CSA2-8R TaxID=3141542 RepID=UPI00315CF1C4